jgi:DNA-binding LytR/AlgR family response regulator
MTKLRCLAIDDEPFALEILADDIGKIPFLDLVGQFSSPLEAHNQLRQGAIDLLFLDIQMPTLTGTEFLRTLTQPAPMVIFTTAFDQYALESYELAVVDYLLKPIPFERFFKAVNKAFELFQLRNPSTGLVTSSTGLTTVGPLPAERDYFFIFVEYREVKIYFDDVLYVQGLKDYVKIYSTQQAKPFLSRITLKAVLAQLPGNAFCRVHKSFIVALSKISSSQRTNLYIGTQQIPVSSRYADDFERQYRSC